MGKNLSLKKIRISYNAPVSLTFVILCVCVMLLSLLKAIKGGQLISFLFTCPGNKNCEVAFDFNNALDYFRIIFHILGSSDWASLLVNLLFVLLLAPSLEEKYGSVIFVIMIFLASIVSGVLNVCFSSVVLVGANDIVFMLILLFCFSLNLKDVLPLSVILIFIIYLCKELIFCMPSQRISGLACIAGGICGSLLALLAIPKTVKSQKIKKSTDSNKKFNRYDDSTTVVGSIDL